MADDSGQIGDPLGLSVFAQGIAFSRKIPLCKLSSEVGDGGISGLADQYRLVQCPDDLADLRAQKIERALRRLFRRRGKVAESWIVELHFSREHRLPERDAIVDVIPL